MEFSSLDSLTQIEKRETARALKRSPQTIYNWINLATEKITDFSDAVNYQAKNHEGKLNVYQFWVLRVISNYQTRTKDPKKNKSIATFLSEKAKDLTLPAFLASIPTIK